MLFAVLMFECKETQSSIALPEVIWTCFVFPKQILIFQML
ncbi:hypothetical protein THIOSC13_1260004 [uncultured Thiomicrorhabdus sp.]